jgi:hypothetical protein
METLPSPKIVVLVFYFSVINHSVLFLVIAITKTQAEKFGAERFLATAQTTLFNKHFLNRGFRGYARINTIAPRRAYPRPSALSAVFRFCDTSELFGFFSLVPAAVRAAPSALSAV